MLRTFFCSLFDYMLFEVAISIFMLSDVNSCFTIPSSCIGALCMRPSSPLICTGTGNNLSDNIYTSIHIYIYICPHYSATGIDY